MNDTNKKSKKPPNAIATIIILFCTIVPAIIIGHIIDRYMPNDLITIIITTSIISLGLGIYVHFSKIRLTVLELLVIIAIVYMLLAILIPDLSRVKKIPVRLICQTNLKGLGTAFPVYVSEHDDSLPTENWCDLLIENADVGPKSLRCRSDNCKAGESSYAMNANAVGIKLSELPADMVLLFETNIGEEDGERQPIKDCRSFDRFKVLASCFTGDEKVYPDKWNQVGTAEDLTTEHHGKKGCNILFVDGTVKFIKADEIKNLKWNAE